MLDLYKNIRKIREARGMSQEDLAKKVGYTSRTSVAKIEAGKVDLGYSKIVDFAKALDVLPENLMGKGDNVIELDDDMTEALRNEISQQKASLSAMSKETGMSVDQIYSIISGGISSISRLSLDQLLSYLGYSYYSFLNEHGMYDEAIPPEFNGDVDAYEAFKVAVDFDALSEYPAHFYGDGRSTHLYPYVSDPVAAGIPETVEGRRSLGTIAIPDEIMGRYSTSASLLIMRVNGESMDRVIPDGALIALKTDIERTDIQQGDIVVFKYDGQYSLKRFYYDEGLSRVVFRPDSYNPVFTDIVISIDPDFDFDVYIVGKVVMYNVLL